MIFHNDIAILEHDTHLSKWVVEHNRLDFDQNVLPYVLPHIKHGDVIVDVGANIGCYAFAFLNRAGSQGAIHCFEPSEESFECLEHNLKNYPNAYLYNQALSYKDGYVQVVRENNNVGMNFCQEVNEGKIKCISLDGLDLPRVDFIKLDCEGMELDVLRGAERTIILNNPTLFIEINIHTLRRKGVTPSEIFSWLKKRGYEYSNVYPHENMDGDQYDIIATKI